MCLQNSHRLSVANYIDAKISGSVAIIYNFHTANNNTANMSDSSYRALLENIGPFNDVADEYNTTDSLHALNSSKILIIGAGGLGCEILKDLALTGFKHIDIIDMDTIDVSNLNRQFLFRPTDIGKPKAEVASRFVTERLDNNELQITAHCCRIQDKPIEYYRQFDLVVCGLDSVEARRWINATLVSFAHELEPQIIPLIDGGTEGFRGQSRVIIPSFTSCYECTLDMISPKTTYPVCTIANTPRLPEHCIEWASVLEWARVHPNVKFDSDDPVHVLWMYETAKLRASQFNISGVTRLLTLGVVKNIIPAIASTNAIIAASCCNEAFKLVTNVNPILDNYMMYSGDDSIFTYTYRHSKKASCPVCGNNRKFVQAEKWWSLEDLIEDLKKLPEVQMTNPSVSSSAAPLFLVNPPALYEATKANLSKSLKSLISSGTELVVTDPSLPIAVKVVINFI